MPSGCCPFGSHLARSRTKAVSLSARDLRQRRVAQVAASTSSARSSYAIHSPLSRAPQPRARDHRRVKTALKSELVAVLTAALDAARASHAAAVAGATDDEARPENNKDTRGLEQSYLARGQAARVPELETATTETTALVIKRFQPTDAVGMCALVKVDEGDVTHRYFIAPHGGGTVLAGGVQVVTLASPIGRALVGTRVNNEVEFQLFGKLRSLVIVSIE
jgi:transcription elongation GreA/GreB family factor